MMGLKILSRNCHDDMKQTNHVV